MVQAHKAKRVGTQDARGSFYNRTKWDHEGSHVGLWSSLGLVPNYDVLVPGNDNGGPHHMQGRYTHNLEIG